jgi:hypothetical protein
MDWAKIIRRRVIQLENGPLFPWQARELAKRQTTRVWCDAVSLEPLLNTTSITNWVWFVRLSVLPPLGSIRCHSAHIALGSRGINAYEFRILRQVGQESNSQPAVLEPAAVRTATFRDVHEPAGNRSWISPLTLARRHRLDASEK